MASLDELIKKKIRLFEQIPKDMATSAERAQLDAWRTVEPLLRDMDVDSTGNIIQSDANINRIGFIADELNKVLAGGEYKEADRNSAKVRGWFWAYRSTAAVSSNK